MTKEHILDEIHRVAQILGRTPGMREIRSYAGIRPYDWQKFWARWSEAIQEAKLKPNTLQVPYSREFLFDSIIDMSRSLGRLPTLIELRLKARNTPGFPSRTTFENKFGGYRNMLSALEAYCQNRAGYEDIVAACGGARERLNLCAREN